MPRQKTTPLPRNTKHGGGVRRKKKKQKNKDAKTRKYGKLNVAQTVRILQMAKEGKSNRAIGKHFNCSHVAVGKIIKMEGPIMKKASRLSKSLLASSSSQYSSC